VPILPGHDAAALQATADALAAGELVAFPTETVYGLGARADDDAAVAKVFAAKGRPSGHPLIVHVAGSDDPGRFAATVPQVARRLMDTFWPGPLTVIVQRADGVASAAAGGLPTIGLRCPSHPLAHLLLQACRSRGVHGVAAPSANRFGRVSPTSAAHVQAEFGEALTILDGGACELGIESAIVDCSRGHPVLLRPGVLARARIEAAAGEPMLDADAASPRAPGTLAAHYAPRAHVRLMTAAQLRAALDVLGPEGARSLSLAVYSRTVVPGAGVRRRTMPDSAAGAAHELYAALREIDAQGVDLIWVEAPPDTPEWDGVRDRLLRAAAA
jgi:L-threonylcarbamoyladenylate synthase